MNLEFGINKMIGAGAILDEQGLYLYILCFYLEIKWRNN
jgi:hypothetical protein